jgi:hypothetical protein
VEPTAAPATRRPPSVWAPANPNFAISDRELVHEKRLNGAEAEGPLLPAFSMFGKTVSSLLLKLSPGPLPGLFLWLRSDQTMPEGAGQGRGTVPEPMRSPTGSTSCKLSFATARADAQAHRQAVCTNGTSPFAGVDERGEVSVLRVAVRFAPDMHLVGWAGDRAGRRRWSPT